jgi:hypothetical protein
MIGAFEEGNSLLNELKVVNLSMNYLSEFTKRLSLSERQYGFCREIKRATLKKRDCRPTYCLVLILSLILLFLPLNAAHAQTQKGITVEPSTMHIDLTTDQPEYELTYTNTTNYAVGINLSVQDFSEFNDTYQIDYLSPADAANYKYSLSSWISFENNKFDLNPGEKKSIKVYVDKTRITKGGHYAAILAEIGKPNGGQNSNLRAVLSALLFVRSDTGNEVEEGKIATFEPSRDWLDFPNSFIVRFQNSGNVYVVPYGLLQIYDPLGNLVDKEIFNNSSLDALPESVRRYDTNVMPYQKVLLPGFYTAKVNLHFGKTNKKTSATVVFFSQGMFDFVKIGLGILVGLLILLYLRKKLSSKNS